MVIFFATEHGVIEEYPLSGTNILKSNKIDVDDGAIQIDHAQHHDDKTHLLLKGNLSATEKYIRMLNLAGETLAEVDHTGTYHGGVDAPQIDTLNTTVDDLTDILAEEVDDLLEAQGNIADLQTEVAANTNQVALIASHENTLNAATHLAEQNEIVKRDNTGHAAFSSIQTELAAIGNNISLYGDAAFNFVPQEVVNGVTVNKPNYLYRIGRNVSELGDASGVGDGLEFSTPGVGGSGVNSIFIQCNETTPTIDIEHHKLNL